MFLNSDRPVPSLAGRGSSNVRWLATRWVAVLLAAVVTLGVVLGAPAAAALSPAAAAKTDPALLTALASGPEAVSVWVTFADKGESGPQDLVARLARAENELTPRARARRKRANVWPLVDYRDLPVHASYLAVLRAEGFAPRAVSRWFNRAVVRMPVARLNQLAGLSFIRRLEQVPMGRRIPTPVPVAEMRIDHLARPRLTSTSVIDYGLSLTQNTQINVTAVHDSGYIGTGVLVAMFDEGFNYHDKHEALRDQIIAPGHARDFVDGDSTVTDTTSGFGFNHGTWTWGAIAGVRPGAYVGSGFGADFALARTENGFSETPIEMVNWGMAAEWADSLGADVISSSLGYTVFDDSLDNYTYADLDGKTTIVSRAAQIAASKGILVVNSAGNAGASAWMHIVAPADVHGDSLIAVAAVDSNGVPAFFTSKGPTADGRIKPDLAARGLIVPTASASGNPNVYVSLNGTSLSAPIVSGLVACLLQAHPNWSPQAIIRALRETASQANTPDNTVGYGVPDGLAALQWTTAALDTPPPAPARRLSLSMLGPNPMRDGRPVRVRFSPGLVAQGAIVGRLDVFDVRGRAVRDLWSGALASGRWATAQWDGHDNSGRRLPAGIYWIRLRVGTESASLRVVSLR